MLFRSDRKSTRLNSSHTLISYAVFCLKKKQNAEQRKYGGRRARGDGARTGVPPADKRHYGVRRPRLYSPRQRRLPAVLYFFFNDRGTTEFSPLPQHDALPI